MNPSDERVEIELNFNNVNFKAYVTQTLYGVLTTDQDALNTYAEAVYEKEFGSHGLKEVNNNQENEKFIWTKQSTLLLLDTRLHMEEEFTRPKCTKNKLWEKISVIMKQNGYSVTGRECNDKYRNLLHTYKVNKTKQVTTGEGSVNWEFFEQFDAILGCKASVQPPEDTISSSLTHEVEESPTRTVSANTVLQKRSEKSEEKSKTRRREELTLQQYLYVKNKRPEKELEERKRIREQKIELRKAEIRVLQELAEAIKNTTK